MGRSPCCDKNGLKKGPWTSEEDELLTNYIQLHGPGNWRSLPNNAGLKRCGKSCRLRWTNYLRPDIKRGRFSFEEEETIIQLHSFLGNKWSAIAARLPGRTDNEIKNYWNTHIRKRLLRMGVNQVTTSSLSLGNYNNNNLVNPGLLRMLLSAHLTTMLIQQNQYENHNRGFMDQFQGTVQFQPSPEIQQPPVSYVSGQTTPAADSPNMEQLEAMNSSLEQLIKCPSNDEHNTYPSSSDMDPFKFDIPFGSLDLSEFL